MRFIKLFTILLSLITLLSFSGLVEAANSPKKWTFIIFLNGNNSLDRFGAENIKAMEKVGSNDDVNIVVQWASYAKRKVVRLLVQKSTDPSRVTSPIVQDMGSIDMGNYHELENFIDWAVTNYPAEHYFIDVWNHGSGWMRNRLVNSMASRNISNDDITGNVIRTEELGEVMAHAKKVIGHNVDIYGSDACLMAMIEVANEMSSSVNYFVGSQELEPGAGWPYAELLGKWEANSSITAADISKILVQEYKNAYSGGIFGEDSATLSAYDLSKLDNVNRNLAKISNSIVQLPASSRVRITKIINKTQHFNSEYGAQYSDLIHLLQNLSAANLNGISNTDIDDTIQAIKELVINNKTTADFKHANGVSIWTPNSKSYYQDSGRDQRYGKLQFNLATQWGNALGSVVSDN